MLEVETNEPWLRFVETVIKTHVWMWGGNDQNMQITQQFYATDIIVITNTSENCCFPRKISVHQTSMIANGKTLSVLRVNSTEKRDSGFYTCQVIKVIGECETTGTRFAWETNQLSIINEIWVFICTGAEFDNEFIEMQQTCYRVDTQHLQILAEMNNSCRALCLFDSFSIRVPF